jgi:ferredoxin
MKVTLRVAGSDHEVDVHEGESIAAAAERTKVAKLYGSCKGGDLCAQCSRFVTKKMDALMRIYDGKPLGKQGETNFVKTCIATPTEEGVEIDCDRRARLW